LPLKRVRNPKRKGPRSIGTDGFPIISVLLEAVNALLLLLVDALCELLDYLEPECRQVVGLRLERRL
jgi:hypothetical protein